MMLPRIRYKKIRWVLVSFLALASIQPLAAQSKPPRTVRDFFMLLPQKYFEIENLDRDKTRFLAWGLKVEDRTNDYLEVRGDGSQESLKMKLFKRSNGAPVIGLFIFGEWGEKYFFLEYRNRHWINISKSLIPNYKRSNAYQLPGRGKTIKVFARKNFDPETDFGDDEKYLYSLVWNHNKFVVKK